MRKHEQRQIQELLQTIGQAQSEGMYADCQAGAIAAGEYIESIEGEGTRTVTLLEEYCEELYRASIGESNVKLLEKSLTRACESVRTELKPNKIEVAFLPYKRAMSDALESVWKAALDDPQCDTYIVPIPYFDRLPSGAFGQMHYEGDLYPPDLPITDWREYDIEARHPDIIFIHYPYDDDNYVTSQHPDYYSKRLKDFTDLLVYIPYFVCVDDVPENFCVCAGTLYADKVIVQSEKVRQTYINAFKKFERENKCKGRFGNATDKFVALGSPKFDAVINSKREDFTLPDEWAKLIGDKNVVLYNTSVGAMLTGNEQYLQKLRNVLDMFRQCNNVVLWWRPHPLNEATFLSMRPQLLEEYMQIIAEYRRYKIGIYDDSPDLHRAIVMSDYLYSDPSSLIALFAATGKPIIEQICDSNDDLFPRIPVRFGDFEMDDNGDCWAFELTRDGLFKLNLQENTAEFVLRSDSIPQLQGKVAKTHRYISLRRYKDEIICFPMYVDHILVYDTNKYSYQKIEVSKDILISPDVNGLAIRIVVEYKDKFFCFSPFAKAIIVYDAINKTIAYQTKYFEDNGVLTFDGLYTRIPILISDPDLNGNIELLPADSGKLISYNVETQISKTVVESDFSNGCYFAERDNDIIWLFNHRSMILYCWNTSENHFLSFPFSLEGFCSTNNESVFTALIDCGEYLLLFPTYASMIVRFDKRTHTFSEYTDMPVPERGNTTTYKYDNRYKRIGDTVFVFSRFNYTMYELNTKSGCVVAHKFRTYFPDVAYVFDFVNETPKFIADGEADGKAGERIYEYTKSFALGGNA